MRAWPRHYYNDPALSVEFDCRGCAFELRVFDEWVACEKGKSWDGQRRCKSYRRATPCDDTEPQDESP